VQEDAVEYIAATLHRLMKEAEAEGIRRLFLISVRARRQHVSLAVSRPWLEKALQPPAPL
jgi:hypothetical protein